MKKVKTLNDYVISKKLTETDYGIIYLGKSTNSKKIIIKVDKDITHFKSVSKYRNYFVNKPICKIFDCDENENIILMEYIDGICLFKISNFYDRLELAYSYFKAWCNFPIVLSNVNYKEEDIYYKNKIIDLENKLNIPQTIDKFGLKFLHEKFKYYVDHFFGKYPDNNLLHGDLHQNNMLYDGKHITAIDLSPVIGNIAFELTRYIENELYFTINNFNQCLNQMLDKFCESLINREQLVEALYVDSYFRMLDSIYEGVCPKDIARARLITINILNYIEDGEL